MPPRSSFLALWVFVIVFGRAPAAEPAPRPSLLFILTDDQRLDALGASGNPRIHTPHLDAFAARSVRFTQAHVVMSLCSPSRAAILTGRYGSANGVTGLDAPLRAGETTFVQSLRAAGYRTAHSGKWHIGGPPTAVGFDFACYFRGNGTYTNRLVNDQGRDVRPATHVDDYCVDRSIAFLEEAARRPEPFFLFHATQLPHMDDRHAWPAPAEFRDRYDPATLPLPPTVTGDLVGKPPYLAQVRNRAQADGYGYRDPAKVRAHIRDYYAVITQLDAMVGRLLTALDRLQLRERTWIIFMSDNGWLLGEHRLTSKVLAYADSVRVPLVISGPGIAPRTEARLALNLDLAPTLLALAGAPHTAALHGANLLPLIRGEATAWRDAFVYEGLAGYGGTHPMLGAITPEWTLIRTWETPRAVGDFSQSFAELYDRRADPAEAKNIAADPAHRTRLARLDEEIRRHLATLPRPPSATENSVAPTPHL